jgi:hypothetical protein
MGRTYAFECPRCGYRAHVAGGAAEGCHFAVQTIACNDCQALYDAVIRCKASLRQDENPPPTAPKFSAVLNRLPQRGARIWLQYQPACPVSPRHRIQLWKQPDKCPKCRTFLEFGALPYRLWD